MLTSEAFVDSAVHRLIVIELVAGAAVLLAATVLTLLASRSALRPLRHVAAVAQGIAAGDRRRRLHPRRPKTELGQMAASFDAMVDSLEAAVARVRARNLAVAAGVLLLLIATAGALVSFTRRAQRLAGLQMDFVAGYDSGHGAKPELPMGRRQRGSDLRIHERANFSPDKVAMWAFVMGVVLIFAAIVH